MDEQHAQPIQTQQPIQPTAELPDKKRPFEITLKPKWPIKVPLVSIVVSAIFLGSALALVYILSSTCKSTGDTFGCAIGSIFIAGAASLFLLVISSVVMLRLMLVSKTSTSILLSVPACIFVGTVVYSGSISYIWPGLYTSAVRGELITVSFCALAYALIVFFEIWLFRLTNKIHWALTILVAISLAAGSFALTQQYSHHLRVNSYNTEVLKNTEKLTFKLFAPTYKPPGYRPYQTNAGTFTKPYYHQLTYIYGQNDSNDPRPYDIVQFEVPHYYNPPADCGDYLPDNGGAEHFARKCDKIGRSSIGCDVYFSKAEYSNNASAYCPHEGTLIVINTDPIGNYLQPAEIIKLYDSMKLVTPTELQNLVKTP